MAEGNLAWAVVTEPTATIKIENLHPNRRAAQEQRDHLDRISPRYRRRVIPVRIVPASLTRKRRGHLCEDEPSRVAVPRS